MKKLISAIAATAVAASLALSTTVSSSADVIYTAPSDPSEWVTWLDGSPALSEIEELTAEDTADGMKVWFPETATGRFKIMSFLIAQGSGITQVEPEDELHVKVKLDGEKGGTDVRWIFSIAFTAAGTGNMQMSKYIAEAANNGLAANEYGQMPQGEYEAVVTFGDLIEKYDADNKTDNYEKIWGTNGNKYLTGIIVQMATNNPEKNSDKDQALTIEDISVGTPGSFKVESNSNAGTSNGGTTNSSNSGTTTNSSKGGTTTNSSKGQVSTGESILPIVGIAALAVVATSAVIVTKKRAK